MTEHARESVRAGQTESTSASSAAVPAQAGHTPVAEHELLEVAGRRGMEPPREIEVGRTDDPQEREADRVAERTIRMSPSGPPAGTPRATAGQGQGVAPPIVQEVLGSPGTPLDGTTRSFFEPRLGSDLSGVRVHQGAKAAASAQAVDAAAYTVGTDIVFANGRYAPSTSAGQRLLAHELAHVLQQRVTPEASGLVGDVPVGRRLARQDVGQAVDAVPDAPASALDPWPALEKLDSWRVKASALIDGMAAWEMANWIDFVSRTSLNPRLSLADSQLAALAANASGNAITSAGKGFIDGMGDAIAGKSAAFMGATIGTAIEPGGGTAVGFAIGFVIGVLIETASTWAFENITGKTDADEAAAGAALVTGGQIADQFAALTGHIHASRTRLEAKVDEKKGVVRGAAAQRDVDDVLRWAEQEIAATPEPKGLDDRSLADDLLRVWVLEHAANVFRAQRDTSTAQWMGAIEHLSGEQISLAAGDIPLKDQALMFVFQTRAEWAKAGLDHVAQSEEMMATASQLLDAAIEAGEPPAWTLAQHFGNKTYTLAVKDKEAFERYVGGHQGETVLKVACTIDVSAHHSSAVIDEFNWYVDFFDGHQTYFDVWLTWPYFDIGDTVETLLDMP